jgi:hypothetical protein
MEALKKQASKLREHVAKQQQVPASVSQNSSDSYSHQSRASDRCWREIRAVPVDVLAHIFD